MNERNRNMRMKQQLDERMMRQGQNRGRGQMPRPKNNSGGNAVDLFRQTGKLPLNLKPGNVGEINNVVWPFWFTFSAPELAPNTSSTGSFTVTQEASFICMAISKSVFRKTGAGPFTYTYIDPDQEDTAQGDANNLKFQFRDAQSSRVFQSTPMSLDHIGHPQFPTVLQSPIMFLPNATVEAFYSNTDATATYVPFITMFGYRVRIENAQEILSLVTGR